MQREQASFCTGARRTAKLGWFTTRIRSGRIRRDGCIVGAARRMQGAPRGKDYLYTGFCWKTSEQTGGTVVACNAGRAWRVFLVNQAASSL
jgi:hypothetical protein